MLARQNDGFPYVLTAIAVFLRYAWAATTASLFSTAMTQVRRVWRKGDRHSDIAPGDRVRMLRARGAFEKGYEAN